MSSARKAVLGLVLLAATVLGVFYFVGILKPQRPDLASKPLRIDSYESSIEVPVSITLNRVRELLEKSVPLGVNGRVPLSIGGNIHNEAASYRASRSAIAVSPKGTNGLVLATTIAGRVTASAEVCPLGRRGPCEDVRESADLSVRVTVTLSEIHLLPDWELSARLSPDIDVTRADVRLFGNLVPVSLRSKVEDGIRDALPEVKKAFGDFVRQLHLRQEIERAWAGVDHVMQVHERPDTWVVLEPVAISVSPLTVSDTAVSSAFSLVAKIQTILGTKPDRVKGSIPAKLTESRSSGFALKVPLLISLADVSKALQDCCTPIEVDLGNTKLSLSDIQLDEGDGRLVIGADFSTGFFGAKGRMYLQGTPELAQDKSTLQIRDLDFDVRTRERVLDGASEILKPVVLETVTEKLRVNLRPHYSAALVEARERFSSMKLGDGAEVKTRIDNVAVDSLAVGDGTLAVVATASGSVAVVAN